MLSRADVVQRLLDLFVKPRYLEIGVHLGLTFTQVKAATKVAVDPLFDFDYKNHREPHCTIEFHEVPSDTYFGSIVGPNELFDVVFLDGLHIAEQTVRDLLNAIAHLKPDGIILIDDVIPDSYHASLSDMGAVALVRNFLAERDTRWLGDEAWMGDIYKVPFFLKTFMQQYSYATILENHGQTLVWRQARAAEDIDGYTLEQVDRLAFKDLIRHFASLRVMPLDEILSIRRDHLTRKK
jgi:SAM-dependent methyltransferase